MSLYIFLAICSVLLASSLYWFGVEIAHYRRIQQNKAMISRPLNPEDEILRHTPLGEFQERLDARLIKKFHLAGIHLDYRQILAVYSLVSLFFGWLFYLFLHNILGWVIGILTAYAVIQFVVNMKSDMRKREFNRSFANAISVVIKMMRNGIGFEQALLKATSTSNSLMFRRLFEQFFREKNNIGEEEAFANMNAQIDSKELRIFALAVKIGRASGGHFTATLDKVEKTLRYRKKMQDKVGVVTREASIGSYLVAGINVLLYFMIDMNFNGKVSEYFFTSEWGRWQLFGIGLWMIAGLAVNRMITRINV